MIAQVAAWSAFVASAGFALTVLVTASFGRAAELSFALVMLGAAAVLFAGAILTRRQNVFGRLLMISGASVAIGLTIVCSVLSFTGAAYFGLGDETVALVIPSLPAAVTVVLAFRKTTADRHPQTPKGAGPWPGQPPPPQTSQQYAPPPPAAHMPPQPYPPQPGWPPPGR